MDTMETAPPMKAMRVLQIIGKGITLWRHEFLSFSAIYLVIGIPITLLSLPLLRLPQTTSAFPMGLFLYIVIFILGAWCNIAFITAALQAANGDRVQVLQNLKRAWYYFLRYVGVVMLTYLLFIAILLLMVLGIILLGVTAAFLYAKLQGAALIISKMIGLSAIAALVVIGIYYLVYFSIRLSLDIYVCVLEDKGPVRSLKRSFFLVKNNVNPVIGVFFALFLGLGILYLPSIPFYFAAKDSQQLNIVIAILQFAAGLIATPIYNTALVSLYQQLNNLSA